MTVMELVKELEKYPRDMKVKAYWLNPDNELSMDFKLKEVIFDTPELTIYLENE